MTARTTNPESILASFNTWKFKREQPNDKGKLLNAIQHALNQAQPLEFVAYWGKGERDAVGEKEEKSLHFIQDFLSRIKKVYPTGASLTLLLTDTHARLNGYSEACINRYFSAIEGLAKKYGFTTRILSEIAPYDPSAIKKKANETQISDELLEILVFMSERHYRTSSDYVSGAKLYYVQNQIEKKRVGKSYPNSIFLTFNGGELNELFPEDLPIFYMYSMGTGISIKPWFED